MPKRKRTNDGKYSRKKPKQTQAQLIAKAKGELKYMDCTNGLAAWSITSAGQVYNVLTGITRGSAAYGNVIGNTIVMKGFEFRYNIIGCQTNVWVPADSYNCTRVLLFQWFPATTPGPADVLQYITLAETPFSPISANAYPKMKVLYDSLHTTYATNTEAGNWVSSTAVSKKVWIPGSKMKPIKFTSTGSLGFAENQVYLGYFGDSGTSPHPITAFTGRSHFYD